jgi:DNA-binding CsgD family transcriptional regulator
VFDDTGDGASAAGPSMDGTGRIERARGLRVAALEELRVGAEADVALFWRPARLPGLDGPRPVLGLGTGLDAAETDALLRGVGTLRDPWADGRRPPPGPEPDFLAATAMFTTPAAAPVFREVLAPAGLVDALRLRWDEGERTLGEIVLASRTARFSRDDARALRPWIPPLLEQLARADALEAALRPGVGQVVVTLDGALRLASPEGRAWWEGPFGPSLAARVATLEGASGVTGAAGAVVEWQALDGEEPALLLRIREALPYRIPPTALLTPRQRKIATLLLEGGSVREAGKALGVSEQTVKGHVRAIYLRLGVESRVGLARRLSDPDLLR